MKNLADGTDLLLHHTGCLNCSDDQRLLDGVKVCVHACAFVLTGLFTYVIAVAVHGSPVLRHNARYLLLLQHCACIVGFNASGAVVHSLRTLRLPVARLVCWILSGLQCVMAHGLIITLTVMCMCMCLSICSPFRYKVLTQGLYPWVTLASWVLALLDPMVCSAVAIARQPGGYTISVDLRCPSPLESRACFISSLLLLSVLVLLIFGSYALTYLEGLRAGHFSQSNSTGRRTILIHTLQISLHVLPRFVIMSRVQLTVEQACVTFLMFSVAQVLSPVIHGLRCQELRNEIRRFFPRCLKRRVNVEDESVEMVTSTPPNVPGTRTANNGSNTDFVSDKEQESDRPGGLHVQVFTPSYNCGCGCVQNDIEAQAGWLGR